MTTKPTKPVFVLELEVQPRYKDDSGMGRLRTVLKLLLRGFGFRCRSIKYPDGNEVEQEAEPK